MSTPIALFYEQSMPRNQGRHAERVTISGKFRSWLYIPNTPCLCPSKMPTKARSCSQAGSRDLLQVRRLMDAVHLEPKSRGATTTRDTGRL